MTTVGELSDVFVCPTCHGGLQSDAQGLACPGCSTRAQAIAANFIDFLGGDERHAREILGWPNDQIPNIEKGGIAIRNQGEITPEQVELLNRLGLLGPDGRFTPLGRMVGYNSSELAWQNGQEPFEGVTAVPELTPATRLLDLGGGSGQTLRRHFPQLQGTVVCLDADIDILAYGVKLFSTYNLPALFCRGSAHALPLRDQDFDFIICRGVISYTHQKRALTEAFRVLRPGGWMFLRIESINWDFRALTHPTGFLRYLLDLRSLAWGVLLDVTGYQPIPGGKFKGPRAYVSRRRFRKIVKELDGEILLYEPSKYGPQFRGRGTQDIVLCTRKPGPGRPAAT